MNFYFMIVSTYIGMVSICIAASTHAGDFQKSLMRDLFADYEKDLKPICETNDAIKVEVGLTVRQIIELEEPKQMLFISTWILLNWQDCHLKWNASDYGNLSQISLPVTKVWSPDISLYDNANDAGLHGRSMYLVNVDNTGHVKYIYPAVIHVSCNIDVTYFPFDRQTCPLMFGSWAYTGQELIVTNTSSKADVSAFIPNQGWELVGVPVQGHNVSYDCCPNSYPDVTFYVNIRRKPLFYVISIIFPCIVTIGVSLFGFMLPPTSGEKLSLEMTVLLFLSVFLLMVEESLPASSEHFPILGVYFAVIMFLVSLSILISIIVINIHHKGEQSRPIPHWLRILVFRWLARMVCVKPETCEEYMVCQTVKSTVGADTLASFSFSSPNVQCGDGHGDYDNLQNLQHDNDEENFPQFTGLKEVLERQLSISQAQEARVREKIEHDVISEEWLKLAFIADRVFLIVSASLSVLTTLVVMLLLSLH